MRLALATAMIPLFLTACAQQPAGPPVTKFDGTYDGKPAATSACRTWDHLAATVTDGKFYMLANPATHLVYQGWVEPDGKLSADGANNYGGGLMFSGTFANGELKGGSTGLNCDFTITMTKRAG